MKLQSLYLFDVCIAQIWKEDELYRVKTFERHLVESNKYICFAHANEAAKKLITPDLRDKVVVF